MKPLNLLVFVISLSLVSVLCLSCKGGELVNPDRQWINVQNEQINTGEVAGEVAGELCVEGAWSSKRKVRQGLIEEHLTE